MMSKSAISATASVIISPSCPMLSMLSPTPTATTSTTARYASMYQPIKLSDTMNSAK